MRGRCRTPAPCQFVRRAVGRDIRPLLATDGGFAPHGRFLPLPESDAARLIGLFCERLLARLLDRHAISQELVRKLLAWRHPGFSAHLDEPIAP